MMLQQPKIWRRWKKAEEEPVKLRKDGKRNAKTKKRTNTRKQRKVYGK